MFGSHLSVAGGMTNALDEARALKLDGVQVFTKNQQQWKAPALKPAAVRAWAAGLSAIGWAHAEGGSGPARVAAHASYLINLASPDAALRAKSAAALGEELDRASALGIELLVAHPGAATDGDRAAGLERIATEAAALLRSRAGTSVGEGGVGGAGVGVGVVLCLENVAGAGTTLGRSFEELAQLRARMIDLGAPPARVGFCFDTCHAHAAGYDLSTRDGAGRVLDELDRRCGLAHVRCVHVNDSKGACGSRLDRHEHIGRGTIGKAGFAAVVNRPEWRSTLKILETPKGAGPRGRPWDAVNVSLLRRLVEG